MAGSWRDCLSLMESLGQKLDELTELERVKIRAVGSSDLPGLEECMKREQVVSLSLRGMDQKRDKLLAELGIAGVRLRDLADHAPGELKREAKDAAERLRQKYELFQSASGVARDALECSLHAIEQIRKVQEAMDAEGGPAPQSDFRA